MVDTPVRSPIIYGRFARLLSQSFHKAFMTDALHNRLGRCILDCLGRSRGSPSDSSLIKFSLCTHCLSVSINSHARGPQSGGIVLNLHLSSKD